MPTTQDEILDTGKELQRADIETLFPNATKPASDKEKRDINRKPSVLSRLSGHEEPEYLEFAFAEKYPQFRWAFPWQRYVVIGVPDGLTKNFVYEFKAASNRHYFATAARPVATTQADIYGMFFERPEKRIQILIREEGYIETIVAPADHARAIATLERFASVDAGALPLPPKAYKCRSCEEATACLIRQE